MTALFTESRYAELETLFRSWTVRFPNYALGWQALGMILQQQGQGAVALAPIHKALVKLLPEDAETHFCLGNTLLEFGQFDGAAASYRRTLELNPNYPEAYSNLGCALTKRGQLDEALVCFHQALEIKPDFADAYSGLGNAFYDMGQLDNAEVCYRRALAINPDFAMAHSNLGNTLKGLGRLNEAEASHRRALEINPDYAEGHNNLGNTFKDLGYLDKAEICYRRALQINPDFVEVHSNLIFALDLMDGKDAASLLEERVRWDTVHATHLYQQLSHSNIPDPERRIRIGYVSADFRGHSASVAFGGLLTCYDRVQFDVFAYSNFKGNNDRIAELFKQNVTVWRNIGGLSDDMVAEIIREDQIDILVDLSGHTAGNRLLVFARKPAPIQITAWGYAAGTGMRAIDVLFIDSVMVPPEDKQYFIEKIRYLPSAVGAFFIDPFPDVNKLPALSDGIVTFGSLNRLAKVSDKAYRAWAQVLLAVPQSRMLLKTTELDNSKIQERVVGYFTSVGVDAERIIMKGGSSWYEHLQAYHHIDIALDPFPHGGGITALEGLIMGVPVITLRWPTLPGRLSASIATTIGLTDWIAETPEQYVDLAIRKATDLQSLGVLRQQLRGIFSSSVLGDQITYARAVEQEYRKLWREWCSLV